MKHVWEKLLKRRGYKLRCTIGEGAYSKVKLAYSYNLKKNVAIKCVKFQDAPVEFLSKFLPRELNTLTIMSHKNIIHVHEVIERYDKDKKSSYVCIVMEYARRGDMLRYIQENGALSESEVKKYFYQLCQAVKYCHSKGICHRDLKCENLLLGKDNKLILSDFGFCKFVNYDFNGNVEPSATFCGSAAYAAPETLQGKPYNPFKHDMWGLGVILFILVSGQMPFDDSDVVKMLKAQNQDNINFLINARCGPSRVLKSLVRLLLQVDVRRRGTVNDALTHPFLSNFRDNLINKKISPAFGVMAEAKKTCVPRTTDKKFKLPAKMSTEFYRNRLTCLSGSLKKRVFKRNLQLARKNRQKNSPRFHKISNLKRKKKVGPRIKKKPLTRRVSFSAKC